MSYIPTELKDLIDCAIDGALAQPFDEDPVLGADLSMFHGFMSSTVRRDGYILQAAVKTAFEQSRFHTVVDANSFRISKEADSLAGNGENLPSLLETELPYRGTGRRKDLDLLVLDHRTGTVTALDVKRAHGYLGSSMRLQATRDTLAIRMLAKDFTRKVGYQVERADARVVAVYDKVSVDPKLSLRGCELDDHFQADISSYLAGCREYYREQLEGVLAGLMFDAACRGALPMRAN